MKIKLDTTALNANKASLDKYKSDLENLNSRVQAICTKINDGWEGEASKSFANMMQKYLEKANEVVTVLNEYSEYVKKVSNEFEENEQREASNIRGSF